VLTWNSDADGLFQLDCTELEQIWLALCGSDEERNEAPIATRPAPPPATSATA
jgi:hypothetical protein